MDQYQLTNLALEFVAPVADAASDPASEAALLRELGFALPDELSLLAGTQQAFQALIEAAIEIASLDDDAGAAAWAELFVKVADALRKAIESLRSFADSLADGTQNSPFVRDTDVLRILPGRLLDYLLASFLRRRFPLVRRVLLITGVLEESLSNPQGSPHMVAFIERRFNWDRLPRIMSDPIGLLKERYGWDNSQGMEADLLMRELRAFGAVLGLRAELQSIDQRAKAAFDLALAGAATVPGSPETVVVRVPLLPIARSPLGVEIYRVADSAGHVDGLGIGLYADPSGDTTIQLSDALRAELSLAGYAAGFGLIVRRGQDPKLVSAIFGDTPAAVLANTSLDARVAFVYEPADSAPIVLLGTPTATHLEVGSLTTIAGIAKPASGEVDISAEIALSAGNIVVRAGEGDGFLRQVLGNGFSVSFDVTVGFSMRRGLYFVAGAGFEITLPVHKDLLGVLKVDSIFLAIQAKGATNTTAIGIVVATSASVKLGPIAASVERLGLIAKLTFPPNGGNLGPANITLGFKPPNGAGLSVDANAVVGGGYLFFDDDKGQYGGVLQLEVKGGIAIKAIGLITTKMPDGSPGFSLLVIITVEFSPIQLGYGFTLNGVGGLAGFNHTMKVDALGDGIKNRTLDSIMFPPDPIANAPKIISDLQTVFPPAPGRFVFAPMAKIAWGSSVLLIEIGLAVELPSPLRLAILGKLHLKLPPLKGGEGEEESKTLVEIHMDVLGILDFDRSEASVDAVLYNSRLVEFPISGGMAMRLRWGADPVFALAIGGFNPRFTPPAGFPLVDRLALQLNYEKDGLIARLRLESYLAVTANSLQFGARIDAYAKVSEARVAGYLGFDALIEFSPFHFIVDIYGGVSVQAFSFGFNVDLLLTLSGPGPWLGDGHVTINFLGKHEFPIHFTVGEEAETPALPPVDPLDELELALSDRRNWSAALPAGGSMIVTLRQLSADETKDQVLAHPLGELTIRQKVLPFGITLERFGASLPTSPGPFEISQFQLGDSRVVTPKTDLVVRDAFARGQFVNLSEDDKLSAPAFESFRCGQTRIGTDTVVYKKEAKQQAAFEYDVTIIDNKEDRTRRTSKTATDSIPTVILSDASFLRAAQFGAAKQTPMNAMGSAKFAAPPQGIRVRQPAYVVAGKDNLQARGADKHGTYTEAEAARDSDGAGEWQVVEAHELV